MTAQQPDAAVVDRVAKVFRQTLGRNAAFGVHVKREDVAAWTSMKHVELIVALEREFGVRFDGADATDMISVQVILNRLGKKL